MPSDAQMSDAECILPGMPLIALFSACFDSFCDAVNVFFFSSVLFFDSFEEEKRVVWAPLPMFLVANVSPSSAHCNASTLYYFSFLAVFQMLIVFLFVLYNVVQYLQTRFLWENFCFKPFVFCLVVLARDCIIFVNKKAMSSIYDKCCDAFRNCK